VTRRAHSAEDPLTFKRRIPRSGTTYSTTERQSHTSGWPHPGRGGSRIIDQRGALGPPNWPDRRQYVPSKGRHSDGGNFREAGGRAASRRRLQNTSLGSTTRACSRRTRTSHCLSLMGSRVVWPRLNNCVLGHLLKAHVIKSFAAVHHAGFCCRRGVVDGQHGPLRPERTRLGSQHFRRLCILQSGGQYTHFVTGHVAKVSVWRPKAERTTLCVMPRHKLLESKTTTYTVYS
jgi:hypothetical protein